MEHVHDFIKVMARGEVYSSPTDGRHTIWKAHRPLNPDVVDGMSFETADFNGQFMFELEGDLVSAAAQNSATYGHVENLEARSTCSR